MKTKYLVLILAILTNSYHLSFSQGCSDAGFCTIGALKSHLKTDSTRQKLSFLLPVGIGDQSVLIITPSLQYDRQLSSRWAIQTKLTANYAKGDLGQATGLGDLFLAGIYTLNGTSRWSTALTLGLKLPLTTSNGKSHGYSLPMTYQSSLGTVDLIMGVSVNSTRWQLSVGWQQPLSGANANTFLPTADMRLTAAAYPPSNQFSRQADVLGRAAYTLLSQGKLKLSVGLLGIYHVADDTYQTAAQHTLPIYGSQGLTLNTTVAGWWFLSPRIRMGITAGSPLVVRKIRPDGLTRSLVVSPEISWVF
ncbi:hypothetical protein [Spirosoma flavus]